MAQSVEHVIGNDEVISSILITSSKSNPIGLLFLFICYVNEKTALCPFEHSAVFSLILLSADTDSRNSQNHFVGNRLDLDA